MYTNINQTTQTMTEEDKMMGKILVLFKDNTQMELERMALDEEDEDVDVALRLYRVYIQTKTSKND